MQIEIIIAEHKTQTLIDLNFEINLLFVKFAQELILISDDNENITIKIVNEKRLQTHDVRFLNLKNENKKEIIRHFDEFFFDFKYLA